MTPDAVSQREGQIGSTHSHHPREKSDYPKPDTIKKSRKGRSEKKTIPKVSISIKKKIRGGYTKYNQERGAMLSGSKRAWNFKESFKLLITVYTHTHENALSILFISCVQTRLFG